MNKPMGPSKISDEFTCCKPIIQDCRVCRLGMVDGNRPYVIPVNFGYRDRMVYIHTGLEGKKLDAIARNPHVCVEFDTEHNLVRGAVPCKWTMHGESVVGEGTAELVQSPAEKRHALEIIMAHYGGKGNDIPDNALDTIAIIRIKLTKMTARRV